MDSNEDIKILERLANMDTDIEKILHCDSFSPWVFELEFGDFFDDFALVLSH